MDNSNYIAATFFLAFFVFITSRGELRNYMGFIIG